MRSFEVANMAAIVTCGKLAGEVVYFEELSGRRVEFMQTD
jgi:hypothetical protein